MAIFNKLILNLEKKLNIFLFSQINLPIVLTLSRLILAPLILPFLIVYILPEDIFFVNILIALLFLLFGFTDFLDGYCARKYNQVTRLGALLDPIADKFLVVSTLISLLALQKIYFLWVLLFIGREIFITSLRFVAAEQGLSIPVIFQAKAKTAFQIFYITVLILKPSHGLYTYYVWVWCLEYVLLSTALFLSLGSAYSYCKKYIEKIYL